MKKTYWKPNPYLVVIAFIAIFGLCSFAAAYGGQANIVVEGDLLYNEAPQPETIGGAAGTDHLAPERFWQGWNSGILVTSSLKTATTLDEGTLYNYHIIEMSPYSANFTYTLPATSTLSSILPNPGDWDRWVFRNVSSSTNEGHGNPTLTIAAGTGWELMGVDRNVDVINASSTLMMDCFRASASSTYYQSLDIVCDLRELVNAD